MPLLHIIILALVQGMTEFLPISSSGHLVLIHDINGQYNDTENLIIDVAAHIGTLFAVLLYFHKDILKILGGLAFLASGKKDDEGLKMVINLLVASLPVIIAGFVIYKTDPSILRSVEIMAWCTIIFGILLYFADKYRPADKELGDIGVKEAFFIGLTQILALIPGVSRSGITMTAARYLGFNRADSARFSLLLATVAISGAGFLGGINILESGNAAFTTDILMVAGLSFFAGLAAIAIMMRWLEKASFTPFVIYRIILGTLLLAMIYSGHLG